MNNKNVLLTGGTGSFGRAYIKFLLAKYKVNKLVIFSRDELKQSELRNIYPKDKFPQLRFFLGDVRDYSRIKRALDGIDIIVHAAALKQVPIAEYDPFEFIKTNVIGAQNLIEASLEQKVSKVIALSTDKAAAPINLYGATKLCSDKLFIAANNIVGKKNIKFSIVRYGNVFGSRGSIAPLFLDQLKNNQIITVTDKRMTRFNISLTEGIKLVDLAYKRMLGGEIFVPKIPSFKVIDFAELIANKKNLKIKFIGVRPGEKLHEEMITSADSHNTCEKDEYYVIFNPGLERHKKYLKYKMFPKNKSYNSLENKNFLSKKDLEKVLKNYLNYN
jgi:UDP-N-acetylglucosamine 4,6-dehydratase/5-epimerase